MSKQSMPPMSLELGHYKWCHTGYHYTHFPKQLSWLYGTIRHQEQGNPSDVKREKIQIQNDKIFKFDHLFNKLTQSMIPVFLV